MTDNIAIKVENLTKVYHLYDKPQYRFKEALHPFRKSYHHDFYAVNDISFEIKKGETVGIIGKNGAGKSTLLKMITGVLTPTSGNIQVNGKIASLLELGAGFNPEMTGMENIYLNGTLMGFSKHDMDTKLDSILEFADINEFIEQPVKSYSSGMYVRLAFAISISVEPDILIVDEALSVGDLNFKNKCMQRIKQLKDSGVTILFVSHDLGTVQTVCDTAIWLMDGGIQQEGNAVAVCQDFFAYMTGNSKKDLKKEVIMQQSSELAEFTKLSVKSWETHDNLPTFSIEENIEIEFELKGMVPLHNVIFGISIYRDDGDWLIGQTSKDSGVIWKDAGKLITGSFVLTPNILAPANYSIAIAAYTEDFSTCYALTDMTAPFSVRAEHPVWGKVIAPCQWNKL